jgi:DNA processing protein
MRLVNFITPVVLEGASLPHRISDLPVPPKRLYLVGSLPRGPSVAVVGTRNPTETAVAYTASLVAELVTAGCEIWSGGASGIDTAAHRAALACGGRSVVVAPAGWDCPYPTENTQLFQQVVASGGAYLSLVPADRQALPGQFFARNALLTALVRAVVVVQASVRSGARNTAKFARRLGRPLFAVPSCPWIAQGAGCNVEIQLGARILTSAKDVIAAATDSSLLIGSASASGPRAFDANGNAGRATQMNRSTRHRKSPESNSPLSEELRSLAEHLRQGARNVDDLCQRTGRPASVIQSDVLRLTLFGVARTEPSGTITLLIT